MTARHPCRRRKSSVGHQRQTQDGEIVAFDPLEQLHAGTFDLIGAHTRRCCPPRRYQDSDRETGRTTRASSAAPYRHTRTPPSVLDQRNGRVEFMRTAATAREAGHARPRGRPAWQIVGCQAPRSDRRRAPAVPGRKAATTAAFSRASNAATASGACEAAFFSRPRSSMSAGCGSTGMPAASRTARRATLREASTSGSGASHSDIVHDAIWRRRSTSSARTAAAVSSIERRVTSISGQLCLAHKPPRSGNLVGHRFLVDIFVIVAMRFEAEQPVLPNLHNAFRRGEKAHDQRVLKLFDYRAATGRRAQAEYSPSSRRGWRGRSRSAFSRSATRQSAEHRPLRDRRPVGRRHASSCS